MRLMGYRLTDESAESSESDIRMNKACEGNCGEDRGLGYIWIHSICLPGGNGPEVKHWALGVLGAV